jgi:PHP family Zn ribbon phosphoesterase
MTNFYKCKICADTGKVKGLGMMIKDCDNCRLIKEQEQAKKEELDRKALIEADEEREKLRKDILVSDISNAESVREVMRKRGRKKKEEKIEETQNKDTDTDTDTDTEDSNDSDDEVS